MDTHALARSTLRDLQDAGTLFLRRQCSIGVLRVNFDRAATRLRVLAPTRPRSCGVWWTRLDTIALGPESGRWLAVGDLLERFDRWLRAPAAPVAAPAREPVAAPVAPVVEVQPVVEAAVEDAPAPPPPFFALPLPDAAAAATDAPPPPPSPRPTTTRSSIRPRAARCDYSPAPSRWCCRNPLSTSVISTSTMPAASIR
ncbi:MAG: hypothetical protein R3F59_11895 [Myxococcota bacterium]